ncbi:alcohol oxidase [Mycena leptocephala]|nr:alcohol oxidase [Mycena leptocephala]
MFKFKFKFEALLALSCLSACLGKIYDSVQDLPGLEYDFVIVGGGTAGLVVANRLTEIPSFSVLVLEAGVSNEGVLESTVPFFVNDLLSFNIYDWNYTLTPQPGLNGRVLPYYRARLLGGCSAHNIMVYTRGSKDDYDRYAKLTGDKRWSWDSIFPYFLKNEKWVRPADHHDTTGQYNPLVHSTYGLNPVSLSGYNWSVGPRIIQATRELPDAYPFNLDMNSGKPLGVGWLQSTIGGGQRSTSATSYLAPQYAEHKNLHVLLHAQVTNLVNSRYSKGKLVFGACSFCSQASKEIILSAGPVGTPQILMHSGIGNKTALSALGIQSLLDLPSVGQNISDHPAVGLSWTVNSTKTLESLAPNSTAFNEAFAQWNSTRTGPFVMGGLTNLGWLRLDPGSPIFKEFPDPSAGSLSPHIELLFSAGRSGATGHHMGISAAVVSPISRGSITLKSNNPLDPPLIDPGYLTSEFDLYVARVGLQRAQEFVTAPVWNDYVIAPTVNITNFTTDELNTFIRNNAAPIAHLVGSAGMSSPDASYGSLIQTCLSRPIVPGAHTQAATYVIAERGSDLVKASWL